MYKIKRFRRSLFHAQTTSPISKHPHPLEPFCWIGTDNPRHLRQLAVHKVNTASCEDATGALVS